MTSPIEIVTEFCQALSMDGGKPAIRRWFTPDTVWNNVGISVTTGIDEAVAMIEGIEKTRGLSSMRVEMLSIAADGDKVLTERLDIFENAQGTEIGRVMLMGIFEVVDGRITAWRDYADMEAVAQLGATQSI